ncbi:MAG: PAS domain-containing protein [Pseudomonadota bacterium]
MISKTTGFAGLTHAQSELVKHWRATCENGALPARECLDPGAIKAHLSAISIIEVSAHGRATFRLAGSGLRQIFGRDMRGRAVSELDQTTYEMWSLGLARALDMGQPIGGMITGDETSHAWLRLPLRSERRGAMLLCHDALIPNARLRSQYNTQSHISLNKTQHLAA